MSCLLGYFTLPFRNFEKRGWKIVIANSLIILTTANQPLRLDALATLFNNPMKFRASLGSTTYRKIQFSSGATCG